MDVGVMLAHSRQGRGVLRVSQSVSQATAFLFGTTGISAMQDILFGCTTVCVCVCVSCLGEADPAAGTRLSFAAVCEGSLKTV